MSTAIIYSGQARTIAQCLPTQHWHVFRHFTDLHFFIVWQNEPNAVAGVKLLEAKYGKERVHAKLIADPQDLPRVPLIKGAHAPYANAAAHSQLMMQHWYQNEAWKWFVEQGQTDAMHVIRMRGDNFFHSFTPTPVSANRVLSPWWGRFGGINDRFALMHAGAASAYFTVYEKLNDLLADGCPFHPESLLLAAIQKGGVMSDDTLRTEFTTKRLVGGDRAPEIMAPDIAHLAASRR